MKSIEIIPYHDTVRLIFHNRVVLTSEYFSLFTRSLKRNFPSRKSDPIL